LPAIRAQLPATWQYNCKNYKSQDMLERKFVIYPKIREMSIEKVNAYPENKVELLVLQRME